MTNEELERMARKWRGTQDLFSDLITSVNMDRLLDLLRTVRDQQLEEDARLCDELKTSYAHQWDRPARRRSVESAINACAAAIRGARDE